MEHLVFLSHRIPYPPNKGEKSRLWNFLRRMFADYEVHLGCFIDDRADWVHADFLRRQCATSLLLPLNPMIGRIRSLSALASGDPLTIKYFHDRRLASWLEDVRKRYDPRKVYILSSGMAAYVMNEDWRRACRVIDMMDIDSDKWRQYAARVRGPARVVYQREADRLQEFEYRVTQVADATLFVSETETEEFRRLFPAVSNKVHEIRQGVDSDYFSPERDYATPFPVSAEAVVFTGNMDYWPNIDAMSWFTHEVFPIVLSQRPSARLYIVGANPTSRVRALGSEAGVIITGRVSDVRPYIAHAKVMVAPLRIARGIQSKVLEAMAMAKPVVLTQLALEGIRAASGDEVVATDEPEAFAHGVVEGLNGHLQQLAESAHKLVRNEYSWDVSYASLRNLLEN